MLIHRRAFLGTAVSVAAVTNLAKSLLGSNEDPFAALPPSAWHNARQNGLVMIHHSAPPVTSAKARTTAGGQPIIVSGQVLAPDGRTPAAGVTVYAYHTDKDGYYGENQADYPPRFYAWMKTDPAGRFQLTAIQPGRYPGMHVPAHIHFSAWGAGYPPQWFDELQFEGDSYLTAQNLAESAARGPFATVQPLRRDGDGILRCDFRVRLQNECNFR